MLNTSNELKFHYSINAEKFRSGKSSWVQDETVEMNKTGRNPTTKPCLNAPSCISLPTFIMVSKQ